MRGECYMRDGKRPKNIVWVEHVIKPSAFPRTAASALSFCADSVEIRAVSVRTSPLYTAVSEVRRRKHVWSRCHYGVIEGRANQGRIEGKEAMANHREQPCRKDFNAVNLHPQDIKFASAVSFGMCELGLYNFSELKLAYLWGREWSIEILHSTFNCQKSRKL